MHVSDIPNGLKHNLIVMGGESNFCFRFDDESPDLLKFVPRKDWLLDEMLLWEEADIAELLDVAEASLRECVKNLRLPAHILRKERAVGIIPVDGVKFPRESLEETVLVTQKILVSLSLRLFLASLITIQEMSPVGRRLPFCAFNGNRSLPLPCYLPSCRYLQILMGVRRQRHICRHWRQVLGSSCMPAFL
jgi:IMP and pyridine-specific 5'-nucleotidase